MKKLIFYVLVLAMLFSIAGCGGKSTNTESNQEIPSLVWYVPGDKQTDIKSVLDVANSITESRIGAKIDLQFVDQGAFTERMTMNMASQSNFDLCFTGYVNPYDTAVKNGGILALDKYLQETPDLKGAIPDYAWEATKIGGQIYAVPNLQIMATSIALAIQKDLADKYKLNTKNIKTIDDIEPFLKQIKEGEKGIYPYRRNYGPNLWFYNDYEQIKSAIFLKCDGSNQVVDIHDTDKYKAGVKKLRDWYLKGYIRPDIATVKDDYGDYIAGKYAVSVDVYKPGIESEASEMLGREMLYIPISEPRLTTSSVTAAMTAISKTSSYPELAVKFLELLNNDKELYNIYAFGIRDKHYTLEEDGKHVNLIPNSGYAPKATWKFGKQFNGYLYKGQPDDLWEQTEKVNNKSIKSPLLGFALDTDPIIAELSQCLTIESEYSGLEKGSTEPTDELLAERVKRSREAGITKVLDEAKKQVNEFLNNK